MWSWSHEDIHSYLPDAWRGSACPGGGVPQGFSLEGYRACRRSFAAQGKGRRRQQPLTGAGLNVGEFNGGGDIQGRRQDIKGGYEVHFGSWSGPKWLVCTYGPGNAVSWWEELNSNEADCKLTVLKKKSNGPIDAALACK
jgi:hypothetical protein